VKWQKGNNMISEIIILGTGASKVAGAAVQSQLFEKFFSIYRPKSEAQRKIYDDILNMFKDWYGIDETNYLNIVFPTFEELIGLMEVHQDFLGKNRKIKEKPKENLIFLISKVLEELIESRGYYERGKYHECLINRLDKQKKLFYTGFISLNYDMVLESRISKIKYQAYIDYGVERINKINQNELYADHSNKIIVYKPHGSLNWSYCKNCGSFDLAYHKSAAEIIENPKRCNKCHQNLKPYVITPSYFKSFYKEIQKELFKNILETFKGIEKIYICGYSFPDADLHIKYILKEIERKSKSLEVFVYNNHEKKKEYEKKEEEKRYLRFFKNKSKVHYLNKSFQDFCEEGVKCN